MKILIIDDHPMTVEGYSNTLANSSILNTKINLKKAYTCKEAYDAIINSKKENDFFDLVILDYNLPKYEEKGIDSGTDLVHLIRETLPNCKTILITAHTQILIIYDILKNANPDGLVIKNDLFSNELEKIVKEVIVNGNYKSATVKKCVSDIWKKELMVEDFNRQILMYMSMGLKIKDIGKFIGLSTSAIQKRVILMKNAFSVKDETSLVYVAHLEGFV